MLIAGCAQAAALADQPKFAAAPAVANDRLEDIRGGFEIPANLHAGMKLERLVYLNGDLLTKVTADIPDIAHMTVDQANALKDAAGAIVIQNGPSNAFNLMDLGPASTVIQNTLNDQHVLALTTVSISVNTLGAMREIKFQDGLRDQFVSIPGVR
jgi:hypothetical protein